MVKKEISFKLGKDLRYWMLEQKIEQDEPYTKTELSSMDADELVKVLKILEVEVPPKNDEINEDEHESKIIDLIIEEQKLYKSNVWVYQNEQQAISKMTKIIEEQYPAPRALETVQKISQEFNLQEIQVVADKINLKSVSWLMIHLMSPI